MQYETDSWEWLRLRLKIEFSKKDIINRRKRRDDRWRKIKKDQKDLIA